MIATFWFLIKTCFFIAALALMLSLGGSVSIEFQEYAFSTTIGIFLLCLCIGVWVVSIVIRALVAIVTAPQSLARYNEKRAQRKGLQAIAYGLSAVAAGDVKAAGYYTKRITRYLKGDDFGLSHLLTALTAKMEGDETQTRRSFHSLMLHKETSFLGLKGLLQTAIDKRDYRYARILAEKAYDQHPNQPWIIKTLYDLEVKTHQYEEAFTLLKKAQKAKLIDKKDVMEHRAALLVGQDDVKKAYKAAPHSLPIALAYLSELVEQGKRRKSLNLIKKTWANNPYPTLMDYWIKFAPKKTRDDAPALGAWIAELYNENPNNASSALYTGQALLNVGQKDSAKLYIKEALSLKPTIHTYQLMYQIDGMSSWMDYVAAAPQDKAWVCTKTGRLYQDWHIVTEDGHFNCIVWDYPEDVRIEPEIHTSPFLLAA